MPLGRRLNVAAIGQTTDASTPSPLAAQARSRTATNSDSRLEQ
jgi:hypothetical protein